MEEEECKEEEEACMMEEETRAKGFALHLFSLPFLSISIPVSHTRARAHTLTRTLVQTHTQG